MTTMHFDINVTLKKIARYLVPQGPLKEFVAQNTLRGFIDLEFHDALRRSAATWGAWSYLPLGFYRNAYSEGLISESALTRSLEWNIEDLSGRERTRADLFEYPEGASKKPKSIVGKGLRAQWMKYTGINPINKSLPLMYRLLGAYLDQGISIWRMPTSDSGFLASVRQLVGDSVISYHPFEESIAQDLLKLDINALILKALEKLVGNPELYERYIIDVVMSHPGWSSTVAYLEANPDSLVLPKSISLKEVVAVELILDAAFLSRKLGPEFRPLSLYGATVSDLPMESKQPVSRIDFIKLIWHEAWEWSLYEKSLALISKLRCQPRDLGTASVQALFCIDDRECSVRRYLESVDPKIETYGLPGFFGIDFMYQCATDLSPIRHAPIVVTPKHLITSKFLKGQKSKKSTSKQFSLDHSTHTIFRGWLMTQVMGISAAVKLAIAILKPGMTQATASSLSRVNENIEMSLERPSDIGLSDDGYFHGFTVQEMAQKIKLQLEAIGLVNNFAPLVVLLAHGSSSTNNTHFSAYDCGACSGKPGSPNARAFAQMANRVDVRAELRNAGIIIPDTTTFIAALHDTTRDEAKFFDLTDHSESVKKAVADFSSKLKKALQKNAKERCRRFELVDPKISEVDAIREVRRRSVAIFEPRPELTHTGNAMAIVGRRPLTAGGFFDRRAFLHSYDPTIDRDGGILRRVLAAVIPVCGGINLNYYFSKLDNEVYGASTKLPHNIIGLVGVCNGVEGDIQTGLPRQMIEFHDPVRLQLVIEQNTNIVSAVLDSEPAMKIWIQNNWIRLMCVDPLDGQISLFKNGKFISLDLGSLPEVESKKTMKDCFEGMSQNCPLAFIVPEVNHGA